MGSWCEIFHVSLREQRHLCMRKSMSSKKTGPAMAGPVRVGAMAQIHENTISHKYVVMYEWVEGRAYFQFDRWAHFQNTSRAGKVHLNVTHSKNTTPVYSQWPLTNSVLKPEGCRSPVSVHHNLNSKGQSHTRLL